MSEEAAPEVDTPANQESGNPSIDPDLALSLKSKLEETTSKVSELEAKNREAEAKKKDAERKAKQQKKIEEGRAQEAIEALNQQLEAAQSQLQALESRQSARIESMLQAMPDDAREKVSKWRDKMSLADFEEFVSEAATVAVPTATQDEKVAPPPASPVGIKRLKDGERQLQPETLRLLEEFNVSPAAAMRLKEEGGKFARPLREFINDYKERAGAGVKLTKSEADARMSR